MLDNKPSIVHSQNMIVARTSSKAMLMSSWPPLTSQSTWSYRGPNPSTTHRLVVGHVEQRDEAQVEGPLDAVPPHACRPLGVRLKRAVCRAILKLGGCGGACAKKTGGKVAEQS